MAKPRISTGRIPFQLGISGDGFLPIVGACTTLSQRPKPGAVLAQQMNPLATLTLAARQAALSQRAKPLALVSQAAKPIASIAQRPC